MDIRLNENTFWVGKVDNRDVPFHRLVLSKGTTYNSYLIKSGKPTIIDTVDISFGKEFRDNLAKLIDLKDIRYIVINHTEPDHSGGLKSLVSKADNAIIVCTEPAEYELKEMYKLEDREFLIVTTGDTLDIGGKTLSFIEAPYLHTEETMLTYCIEDEILYSCDVFSTHVANDNYFDDREKNDISEDFKIYYQLIMHPHRLYVREMLHKISGLSVKMIAPSHGYILRENAKSYIDIYDDLSSHIDHSKKALILYSSMTGNTKQIASEIKAIYDENELPLSLMDVNKESLHHVLEKIEQSDIIFFGSSTRYADLIGSMEVILKELGSLKLKGKIALAFGSYGWSGEPIEIIQDYLKASTFTTLSTSDVVKSTGMVDLHFPIRIRFSLNEEKRIMLKRAVYFTIDILLAK